MQTYFLRLFNFDYWANKKLLLAMREPEFLPERIHHLFSHLLATTQIWHGRLTGSAAEVAHSSYHQGQLVAALKPIITALPDISYITYIREKQQGSNG